MDKNNNPMSRLMELAAPYKSQYVLSVVLAVLGVAAGLLPFFCGFKDRCSPDEWRNLCFNLYGVVFDCRTRLFCESVFC